MKLEVKNLPNSEIELIIEIDTEKWEGFIEKAIKELSDGVKIKGFRPGKIPRSKLESLFGSQKILDVAAELAVQNTYFKAIDQEKIEPISSPEINILKQASGNPLIYKAKVVVLPEVELADYKNIAGKIKKEKIEVGEDEIKKAVDWVIKSRRIYKKIDRPAQKGDRVEINFEGFKDHVAIEGAQSNNYPLILGEGKFVYGFEDNLIGLSVGQEKEFSVIFPEDYYKKELAGCPIDFKVNVNVIEEVVEPELNNEFVKSLGGFENVEEFKKNIKEGLIQEKESQESERWHLEVVKETAKESKMELPDSLVEAELEKMSNELKQSIEQMGMEWEVYLSQIKKSEDDLRKEWREKAKERVRIGLCLRGIVKKEKIEVSEEEISARVQELGLESWQENKDKQRIRDYIKGMLLNEKAFKVIDSLVD